MVDSHSSHACTHVGSSSALLISNYINVLFACRPEEGKEASPEENAKLVAATLAGIKKEDVAKVGQSHGGVCINVRWRAARRRALPISWLNDMS
jgi:hypothetical protein